MALSSAQINSLIELHRKNATLEAELSYLQSQNRQLNAANAYLMQQLAFRPITTEHAPLNLGNKQPSFLQDLPYRTQDNSCVNSNYKSCGTGEHSAELLHRGSPDEPHHPSQEHISAAPDDISSDGSDDYSLDNDRKLKIILENPNAPRFAPPDATSGYHRTVMITGLPTGIGLKELSWKTSGGLVVSMILLHTHAILGSTSAMVQFFEENAALNFIDHCTRAPLMFNGDCSAKATILKTPTTPVSIPTYRNIVDYCATRHVVITGYPRHLSTEHVRAKLSPIEYRDLHGILEMWEVPGRRIHIKFDSIERASSAQARVNAYSAFKPARAEFAEDPCAVPCNSLSLREARPTLFINQQQQPRRGPPVASRVMRGPGHSVRALPYYRDMDAPPAARRGKGLDYGDDVGPPPPTPLLRRAEPVDYSELDTSSARQPIANILDNDDPSPVQQGPFESPESKPSSVSSGSQESGEIVEVQSLWAGKPVMHESKHASDTKGSALTSSTFMPITNRHLGAPEKELLTRTTGKAEPETGEKKHQDAEADTFKNTERRVTFAQAISSASSVDSVESERARDRRHADNKLGEMQKLHSGLEMNYG